MEIHIEEIVDVIGQNLSRYTILKSWDKAAWDASTRLGINSWAGT